MVDAVAVNATYLRQEQRRRRLEDRRARGGVAMECLFPDHGPYGRAHYPRHVEFFAAGAAHRERMMLAANRVGKTLAGAYEITLHLTGAYPEWWVGRRFTHAVRAWACGDTNRTARDILQATLLGQPHDPGAGVLPPDRILRTAAKPGVADALESVLVRHESGAQSELQFRSYDQGREAYQGTAQHVIWLDEEPPEDIYTECLLRTMETSTHAGGIILCTFTPLLGMTPLILSFLEATHAA